MPTPWMIASQRPEKTKAKNIEIEEALKRQSRSIFSARETHQKTRKFGDRLFLFASFVCFVGPIFLWTSVSSVQSAGLRRAFSACLSHNRVPGASTQELFCRAFL